MSTPFIVGVTGGSGSGKSTFTKLLSSLLGDRVSLLTLDNYYYPIYQQPRDAQGHPNFDLPESLDLLLFQQDLITLKAGQSITQKEYTFNNPDLIPKEITISHAPILLVEGLYLFYREETEALFDLKIFIDTDETVKLQRRLLRDAVERGYNEMDVHYTHQHHVTPAFEKYIQHYQSKADLIVPNHHNFDKALEVLQVFLKNKGTKD